MKIGFVFDDSLDKPDGVQQYVLMLGKWLTSKGHDVHYLVGETTRTDLTNLHSLTKNMRVRFNQNRLSIPLPLRRSKAKTVVLAEPTFDVLHVQVPYSPQMAARLILAADPKTAIVGTFHILPYSNKEAYASKLLASIERRSLVRINTLVSVSSPAAMFAKNAFKMDSVIVPNPVDVVSYKSANRLPNYQGKFTIVYLGRFVERKGVMEFLKAVLAIRETIAKRNICVILVGSGPLEQKVKDYINKNDLSRIVECAGFVTENEKKSYLASADIAVFPSLGGESFGIVLTEAMAAGAGVVIGGNNPGYMAVLEDPRTIFEPRNIQKFAHMLDQLIHDPALRKDIHASQKERVKQYDIETVGTRILEIYSEAIAKNLKNRNNKTHETI